VRSGARGTGGSGKVPQRVEPATIFIADYASRRARNPIMNTASIHALRVAACALMLASVVPGRMVAAPEAAQTGPVESCPVHQPAASARPNDIFAFQVRPILEAHCQPCHFEGGKMYASMPFDRPETIRMLGEKMFSRIKVEREAAALRAFLAEPAPPTSAH
jgi:hypothetical protein